MRQDLYFRLAVFELELPPLRQRRDDIPALPRTFIKQMGEGRVESVSAVALERMMRYDWPGNIRELQNLIQRSVVMCNGTEIQLEDLPERVRAVAKTNDSEPAPEPEETDDTTLEDFSRRLLVNALTKHDGNASAAMRELNIGRTRFYRMLKRFGLEGKIDELRQGN